MMIVLQLNSGHVLIVYSTMSLYVIAIFLIVQSVIWEGIDERQLHVYNITTDRCAT